MAFFAHLKAKGSETATTSKMQGNASRIGLFSNNIGEQEIRDICRHHIDSFENWSRRLIDETLKAAYGDDYFNYMVSDDQPLVKSEMKRRIEQRMKDDPTRFPRKIDAILMEDIEYFLCRDDLYQSFFKAVLEPFYSGKEEIRSVLGRMISIRNKLSHGNTISFHEAEQCICYTSDFIEQYKEYYVKLGKERNYNVPVILRIKDCLGHDIVRRDLYHTWKIYSIEQEGQPEMHLRSGDEYFLWIEVDSSFDPSFYEIRWDVKALYESFAKGSGPEIRFRVSNKEVSYAPHIDIILKTKRDWHRFHEVDDIVEISLNQVLPPIKDTY